MEVDSLLVETRLFNAHCFFPIRLRKESEAAGKLMEEVRQISDTALHLKTKVEEVSHEKEQTVSAYQVI